MSRAWWRVRRYLVRFTPAQSLPLDLGSPFRPTPIDAAADQAWVTELVDLIAPNAVDEGTGSVLDELIEQRTRARSERVHIEYLQYVGDLHSRGVATHAQAARQATLADFYPASAPAPVIPLPTAESGEQA